MAAAFFYYKNVTWREMLKLIYESALLTAAVIFLLAVASVYQFLMGMLGVPRMLGELLGPLASTPWLFLVAVSLIVILFGMVLEGLPAAVVLVPVVFPIAKEVGIHPVHFNIVLTAAVGIGLFLPPIGVGLLMALRFANISVGQHFKAYWPYLSRCSRGCSCSSSSPGSRCSCRAGPGRSSSEDDLAADGSTRSARMSGSGLGRRERLSCCSAGAHYVRLPERICFN